MDDSARRDVATGHAVHACHDPAWLAPDDRRSSTTAARCPLDRPFTRARQPRAGSVPTLLRASPRGGIWSVSWCGAIYAVAQLRDTIELRTAALAPRRERPGGRHRPHRRLAARRRRAAPSRGARAGAARRLRRRGFPRTSAGGRQRQSARCGPTRSSSSVASWSPAGRGRRWTSGRRLPRYDALGALDAFLRSGCAAARAASGASHRFKGHRGVVQLRELVPLADPRAESHAGVGAAAALARRWAAAADAAGVGRGQAPARLDLGIPEIRYGAEYHGEALPRPRRAARGTTSERTAWLAGTAVGASTCSGRTTSTARTPTPPRRCGGGVRRARAQLGDWRPQGQFLHRDELGAGVTLRDPGHGSARLQRVAGSSEAGGGGAVEEPDDLGGGAVDVGQAGHAAGGGVVEVAVVGEGPGDGLGLLLAAGDEPDGAAAVEGAEVRLTRSGGGLGESVTATATWSSTSSAGCPGKSEAQWPSGPMPSISTSKAPGAVLPQRLAVRRRGLGHGAGGVGGRRLVHVVRRARRPGRGRSAARRGRCGRRCRGRRTARHPTRRRRATSRRRSRARAAPERGVDALGDRAAGQRDLRHPPVGLRASSRGSSSPATARASASASSRTSIRVLTRGPAS